MPKSLYARALIIIIAPIVILQSVLVFVFMERHWNTVTRRLSAAVTNDIAYVIDLLEVYPREDDQRRILRVARENLQLNIALLPSSPLPPPAPKPFFTLLDQTLSNEISIKIGKPFWVDTVGRSKLVEIRIQLDDKVVQFFARRSQTYASNSHIFLFWMVGTAMVLLVIAILFMRNQIRPIQRLANAAEDFGKGRDHPNFKPSGATEVRRASHAFLKMRGRIQRQIEQRTTMLAGVSHDLRTILTRFKLQLALMEGQTGIKEMQQDVDDMQTMLEGYLAFARGDSDEPSADINLSALFDDLVRHANMQGKKVIRHFMGEIIIQVRPVAFRRGLENLWTNAIQYANMLELSARQQNGWITIIIDDDGPGIPEEERENVFRPFFRLDEARNLNSDHKGTGLGLAIALDIARTHGGDIKLNDSPLGGLRVILRVPA